LGLYYIYNYERRYSDRGMSMWRKRKIEKGNEMEKSDDRGDLA
jgi:hypothetical protein